MHLNFNQKHTHTETHTHTHTDAHKDFDEYFVVAFCKNTTITRNGLLKIKTKLHFVEMLKVVFIGVI